MESLNASLTAGNTRAVAQKASECLAGSPQDAEALVALAKVALVEGRASQATSLLQRAEAVRGPTVDTQLMRAALALQQGDTTQARNLYQQMTRQPSAPAEAFYGLGIVLARSRDLPGATQALSQAVELKPSSPEFLYTLSRVLLLAGQQRRAMAGMVLCLRSEPRHVDACLMLAGLLVSRRKLRSAHAVLTSGLEHSPEEDRLRSARAQIEHACASTHATAPPDEATARAIEAARLLSDKRPREALKVLKAAAAQGLSTVQLKLLEATAYGTLLVPDMPNACRAYEEAMALDPSDRRVPNNFAHFLMQQGASHLPRAIALLEKALQCDPTSADTMFNLALACARGGQKDRSTELARQLEAHLSEDDPLRKQTQRILEVLKAA